MSELDMSELMYSKYRDLHVFIMKEFPEITDDSPILAKLLEAIEKLIDFPNLKKGMQLKTNEGLSEKELNSYIYENTMCENIVYRKELAYSVTGFLITMCREQPKVSTDIPVKNLSDADLVERYKCDMLDSEVEEELARRSKGRYVIVFKDEDEGVIDKEETLSLLKEARKRGTPPYYTNDDGENVQVYKVLQTNLASRVRDLSPADGKTILFRDTCTRTNINFSGVSYDDRVKIRLMGISLRNPGQIREAVGMARAGKLDEHLKDYTPQVLKEYETKKLLGKLPSLKALDRSWRYEGVEGTPLTNDPFYRGVDNG